MFMRPVRDAYRGLDQERIPDYVLLNPRVAGNRPDAIADRSHDGRG